ncbi:nuclear transport factor 2 family protein [Microbacterium sp.]|uniref:nuclear transport factor 2 family protein n=1 Tax=Microbacterium sp. TaxID=51671 RepID=UPI003736594E
MSSAETEVEAVLRANRAFYSAIESGDADLLRAVWTVAPESVCLHPGMAPLHDTEAILRSWTMVMAGTPYIQFFLTDVQVTVHGDVAAVTLDENVLVAGEDTPAGMFQGGGTRAVNVFTKVGGQWRMWLHQASPVVSGPS